MTARIVDGVLQSPVTACDYHGISVPELVRTRLEQFADKVVAVDVDTHLTGAELLSRIRRCAAGFSREGLQKGTRVCCQVGNSLDNIVAIMGVVFAGGTLVMAKASFVERELRYQIEDSECEWILTDAANSSKALHVMENIPLKVTSLIAVPMKMQMLLNEAKSTGRTMPHIDKIVCGGSPMSSSLYRDICDMLTPSTLGNIYGMTETFGLVSASQTGEITTEHMGLPCAGCEVKVVDVNTGKLLEPFEQGEICVRCPHVMKCYHRRPEATAEILGNDGWLRTGDLGYYDREGHLYMVERLKQLIKCMDSQLAPSELEEILLTHDAVAEVAVVGVPSPKYGEAPAACVVLNASYAEPHSVIEEELKKLVAGQTAVYKYLYGGVIFLDSLPRADNGKILKKQLLAKFADRPIP